MTTTIHVVQPGETPVGETMSFSTAFEVLADVIESLEPLDDQPLEVTREGKAEVSRTLLNAADQLDLAASLVRNVYWQTRGRASYVL